MLNPNRMLVLSLVLVLGMGAGGSAVRAEALAGPAAPQDTVVYPTRGVTVFAPRVRALPGSASSVEVELDSAWTRPVPTLEQVLRQMPLVIIRANSRGEAQPALRGAEDRQIAVLVDGVPITLGWDHRTDLSVVPLSAARRVALTRGLSSLLLGPNVLGGAVEVDIARGGRRETPPAPLALDAAVDHTGARSVGLSGGALTGDTSTQWVTRGGVGYRGQDGFPLARHLGGVDPAYRDRLTPDGDLRRNSDLEGWDGFLALKRVTGDGAWVSLAASGSRLERGVPPEAHLAAPRLWRYPYQARALGALSAGTGMRSSPWGRGDLEASLGLDLGRTEIRAYDGLDYGTVNDSEDDDDRTWTARLLGDHSLGGSGDLRAALTWADIAHDEVLMATGPASYRQRLWSMAGETDWRLGGPLPVRLSLGAAADGSDTPVSADKPALGRLWDWAGRCGATAVLADGGVLVHGAASRRARFPSLRELYSGALGKFLPNPGLSPEVVWIEEGGVTARRGAMELQVVGFHQRLEDAITRVSVQTPTGRKYQRVNQNAVQARGVEIVASAHWRGLDLGGDLTLQRVRAVDAAGTESRVEYEPGASGGVWLEAPIPARLRAGVVLRHIGREEGLNSETGAFESLAPGVRVDARLTREIALAGPRPWTRLDLVLAVENLADRMIYDQLGLPQPGRTIRLQTRLW